jgi:hypothetical protein
MIYYAKEYIEEAVFYWSIGMDIETISSIMGLSVDEVNELIDLVSPYV